MKQQNLPLAALKALILIPLGIVAAVVAITAQRVFGLKATADLTASEVENYLQDWLDGTGAEWDWDDFTSVAITDPELEQIRAEAIAAERDEDRLRSLVARARACAISKA